MVSTQSVYVYIYIYLCIYLNIMYALFVRKIIFLKKIKKYLAFERQYRYLNIQINKKNTQIQKSS